jgi:hypothetical protein
LAIVKVPTPGSYKSAERLGELSASHLATAEIYWCYQCRDYRRHNDQRQCNICGSTDAGPKGRTMKKDDTLTTDPVPPNDAPAPEKGAGPAGVDDLKTYEEHNTDKPHKDPKMQCQCEACKRVRGE